MKLQNYSIELLAEMIKDSLTFEKEDFENFTEREFEFKDANVFVTGFAVSETDAGEITSLERIDIHSCNVGADDGEYKFNDSEVSELTELVYTFID